MVCRHDRTCCSIILSWLLSKVHVNRIKRLQEATSLVAAGDYTVRLPSSNFDEIGELEKILMKW